MKKLIAVLTAIVATAAVASQFAYVAFLDAQTRTMEAGAKIIMLKSESDMRMLAMKVQLARLMGVDPTTGKSKQNPDAEVKPSAKDGTPLQTL